MSETPTDSIPMQETRKPAPYRDMQLLHEVEKTPNATQRDLAKRMGVALGLANVMLRRLVKKGYIKITGTRRDRILYLITPQGLLEKSRLTYEYIEYSLQHYRHVRKFLGDRLESLIQQGHRRVLLFGRGELAEIAYLTIQGLDLELLGVVGREGVGQTFLRHPIREMSEIAALDFDGIIVASMEPRERVVQWLLEAGVSSEKIIVIPGHRTESFIGGVPPLGGPPPHPVLAQPPAEAVAQK